MSPAPDRNDRCFRLHSIAARERDTNELGNRTLVDRRGNPRNIARSAQTARAAEATTPRNRSLGGRRRSCSRESRAHGSANCTHAIASAPARAATRPSIGAPALLVTIHRLPDNTAGSPFTIHRRPNNASEPNTLQPARLILTNIFRGLSGRRRRRPETPARKKGTPGSRAGRKFVFFSRTVRFTRLAWRRSDSNDATSVLKSRSQGSRCHPRTFHRRHEPIAAAALAWFFPAKQPLSQAGPKAPSCLSLSRKPLF